MNTLPKISIITPVLNGAKTIEKTIQSVIDQQYTNLEFIILDGGSTDNTVEIIKRYQDHISYWHSKKDKDSASAANDGFQRANGDLVALLMADDFYEPNTLNKIGQALVDHPEADMISCGGRVIIYDEQQKVYKTKETYKPQSDLDLNFQNICFDVSAICCRFIRTSLLKRIGLLIPSDQQGQHMYSNDKEFLLRAILAGTKNIVIDHIGYNYLAHPGSATYAGRRKMTVRLYAEHMMIAEKFLQQNNLSGEQRSLLSYWHRHQSARLAMYRWCTGSLTEAWQLTRAGMQRDGGKWLGSFIAAPFAYWAKKLFPVRCNRF